MMSKFSNLWKGKSVPNLITYSSPWSANDEKLKKAVETQNARKVASLLSKASVTPTKRGPLGKSVFHIACEIGNEQIVNLILEKTHDVNDTTIQGWTALQSAAIKGHTYTVEKLLKASANVNQQDCDGRTALHHAAYLLHLDCVKVLLSWRADPQAVEKGGKTPLSFAASKGSVDICKLLLDKNADIDWPDKTDITPLMYAARGGHRNVVEYLLKRGANPELRNRDDHTALDQALAAGHSELNEVFKRASGRAFESVTDNVSVPHSGFSSHLEDTVTDEYWHQDHSRAQPFKHDGNMSVSDRQSVYSMDDALIHSHEQTQMSSAPSAAPQLKNEQVYQSLREELEQLNASFNSVSRENLKLRDKVESLQNKLVEKRERELQEGENTEPKRPYKEEIQHLREQLAEERRKVEGYESRDETAVKQAFYKDENVELKRPYEEELRSLQELLGELRKKVEAYECSDETQVKQRDDETELKRPYEGDQSDLRELLGKLQMKVDAYESHDQTKLKQLAADSDNPNIDNTQKKEIVDSWQESEVEDISAAKKLDNKPRLNEAMLRSQIIALRQENEQLKEALNLPNGFPQIASDGGKDKDGQQEQVRVLLFEKAQLQAEITKLKEESEKHQLVGAVDQEELHHRNKAMASELESLRQQVTTLEAELEEARRNEPSDAQRLDAILAGSRNFEEDVKFDDDGFVEGRDMTKEEFLQAQNQQLKTHCGLLTDELEKLRTTFDAILKAGDNLQADYDHLASEKDSIHYELEVVLKEKAEVVNENEFLLTDNNDLHENLKKIVHELEKMQEKYQAAQAENEELKRSVGVASKVGEVARLLEERDALQQRCTDFEATSQRLQHDHSILLEEVQSLSDSVQRLTVDRDQIVMERDQIAADLEEVEPICSQHEALQLDYNQLELDFAELLKEKQALEQQVQHSNGVGAENGAAGYESASVQEMLQKMENDNARLDEIITGLSRHNVSLNDKVKDLEKNLAQARARAAAASHEQVEKGVKMNDDSSNKREDELREHQQEIMDLKKQITSLNNELEDWEKRHQETVSTYRTHLLSAVQGHMDPDVKDALYHIIELRSMEQFC